MKTLNIEIPTGFEIADFDKQTGKITFQPLKKEVTERIDTIDDVIRELGENDKDVIEYRKLVSAGLSESLVNYQLAILITKVLNEGWYPDWNNSNEYKYFVWVDMRTLSYDYYGFWASLSFAPSRLALKNAKLVEFAGRKFEHVYKAFME